MTFTVYPKYFWSRSTYLRHLGLFVVVLYLLLGVVDLTSAQQSTLCSQKGGTLSGTIDSDVAIDTDCQLEGAIVYGTLTFLPDTAMSADASIILGDVICEGHNAITLTDSTIHGNAYGCDSILLVRNERTASPENEDPATAISCEADLPPESVVLEQPDRNSYLFGGVYPLSRAPLQKNVPPGGPYTIYIKRYRKPTS